jgi:hypothetical protein
LIKRADVRPLEVPSINPSNRDCRNRMRPSRPERYATNALDGAEARTWVISPYGRGSDEQTRQRRALGEAGVQRLAADAGGLLDQLGGARVARTRENAGVRSRPIAAARRRMESRISVMLVVNRLAVRKILRGNDVDDFGRLATRNQKFGFRAPAARVCVNRRPGSIPFWLSGTSDTAMLRMR